MAGRDAADPGDRRRPAVARLDRLAAPPVHARPHGPRAPADLHARDGVGRERLRPGELLRDLRARGADAPRPVRADGRRHRGLPARPGRDLRRRREHREHARDLAAPRRRQGAESGVGGGRRPRRLVGRARTAGSTASVTDSFGPSLDPLKDGLEFLPGASARTTTASRSAGRATRSWSAPGRCRTATPPTTASASCSRAASWWRPWPRSRASTPTASSGGRATPSRRPRSGAAPAVGGERSG